MSATASSFDRTMLRALIVASFGSATCLTSRSAIPSAVRSLNLVRNPLGAKTGAAGAAVILVMMRLLDNVPTWGEKPDSPSGGRNQRARP